MIKNLSRTLLYRHSKRFHPTISSCLFSSKRTPNRKEVDSISEYTPDRIRNFSIIAHVDHGKSTLADRLLEFTGAVQGSVEKAQMLDRLQVERERGITVKAQTATLFHEVDGVRYLLNLIDTPGHVDFNFEVHRSLAACESVILLVDANEGVQAQTVANFYLAFEQDLTIVPVLNKVDLPRADPPTVKEQLKNLFDIAPESVIQISAKFGHGVPELLTEIVRRTPPPSLNNDNREKPTRCLLVDSWFEPFRGAIALIAVREGTLRIGDELTSYLTGKSYTVKELGIFSPESHQVDGLFAGQVGYAMAGMKSASEATVGDTLLGVGAPSEPLRAFKPALPMVFAGLFPSDQSKYEDLKAALEKLTLNDSSVEITTDLSPALGAGWRLGFLGLLHMDVFRQRLEQEYDASLILTSPSVPHKVTIKGEKNIKEYGGDVLTIYSVTQLPPESIIVAYQEPMVMATLIFPEEYISTVMQLCLNRRGTIQEQAYIDSNRLLMRCEFPLAEIVIDFYDQLKALTSGYASLDYEDRGFKSAPMMKLEVQLNETPVEELSMLVHTARAKSRATTLAESLAREIPRQQFMIRVKVCHGKRTLAKADIRAYRKDVTQKIKSGSDVRRKNKLLKQQADGKRRMRLIGRIEVPREAFINVLKQN